MAENDNFEVDTEPIPSDNFEVDTEPLPSIEVDVDPTLSHEGQAADAKAVGDVIFDDSNYITLGSRRQRDARNSHF